MRTSLMISLGLLGCLLIPSAALSQDPTGACYGLREVDANCVNGLTQSECLSLTILGEPLWAQARDCDEVDVPFPWDGSCEGDFDQTGASMCVLMWTASGGPFTSQEHCVTDGGVWSDDLICGTPVPAMPKFTLALMACLLLGVALLVMAARGRLPMA